MYGSLRGLPSACALVACRVLSQLRVIAVYLWCVLPPTILLVEERSYICV